MLSSTCLACARRHVVTLGRPHDLLVFAQRVGLGTKVGSGGAGLGEVPSKHGLQEGSEDEMGTAEGLLACEKFGDKEVWILPESRK
jgi:hypothetical protein